MSKFSRVDVDLTVKVRWYVMFLIKSATFIANSAIWLSEHGGIRAKVKS